MRKFADEVGLPIWFVAFFLLAEAYAACVILAFTVGAIWMAL